jgi:hypothetical protein
MAALGVCWLCAQFNSTVLYFSNPTHFSSAVPTDCPPLSQVIQKEEKGQQEVKFQEKGRQEKTRQRRQQRRGMVCMEGRIWHITNKELIILCFLPRERQETTEMLTSDSYECPECTAKSGRQLESRATLIVCPESILTQWQQEIERHTQPGALKVAALSTSFSNSSSRENYSPPSYADGFCNPRSLFMKV